MTTIAYRGGILAADTLATRSGSRVHHTTKIFKRGKVLAGACGATSLSQSFKAWFLKGCEGDCPDLYVDEDCHATGFIITPDGTIANFGKSKWFATHPHMGISAWGSGQDFALGAMAAGATADEAVQVAILFDIYSGGDVMTLRAD